MSLPYLVEPWFTKGAEMIPLLRACIWSGRKSYWAYRWEAGCNGREMVFAISPLEKGWAHCPYCGHEIIVRR